MPLRTPGSPKGRVCRSPKGARWARLPSGAMMRNAAQLVCFGFASSALLLARAAAALPPPMTEQELMDDSDLVIDGVGMSIECEGPPVLEGDMISTYYVTQVFPSETYKGEQMRSVTVRGQYVQWLVAVSGPWFPDAIPVGWSGRLYLADNEDGTYSEVWWNGTEEDATSAPDPLPDCGAGRAGGGAGGSSGDSAGGGMAGAGGPPGSGGGAGVLTGGAGGDVSGGSGGDSTGGAGGDVSAGTSGDVTGGSAGTVAGASGSSGAGGSEPVGEAGRDDPGAGGAPSSEGGSGDESGCSCSAARRSAPYSHLLLMVGSALAAVGLRRAGRSRRQHLRQLSAGSPPDRTSAVGRASAS